MRGGEIVLGDRLHGRVGGHIRASRLRRLAATQPVGVAATVVLVGYVAVAVVAKQIAPYDPLHQNLGVILQQPSAAHPMGTDTLGRDVLSRVVYGARISLYVGLASVILGMGVGAAWGLASTYAGGWVDITSQRLVDVMMVVPQLVLALLLVSLLGASINNVVLALSIAVIPRAVRIVRSATLAILRNPFIESAKSVGAGPLRVMLRHLLPNVAPPILVYSAGILGLNIVAEASLSFLGLGVPLPTPSWGQMLSGNNLVYFEADPWLGIFPGLVLALLVLAANSVGDMLQDVWDPRLRGS